MYALHRQPPPVTGLCRHQYDDVKDILGSARCLPFEKDKPLADSAMKIPITYPRPTSSLMPIQPSFRLPHVATFSVYAARPSYAGPGAFVVMGQAQDERSG